MASDSFIFNHERFHGLTCFQIAYHSLMRGLWNCNHAYKGAIGAEVGDTQQKRKPHLREVNTSHAMFLSLRNKYSLGSISRKKSRA